MIYKDLEGSNTNWRSDRYSFQEASDSFLNLPKNPSKRTLEIQITEMFMQAFNPENFEFDDFILEDLRDILLDKKKVNENVITIIRNSGILYYIYDYLDFVIKNNDNYRQKILIPCQLIGVLLHSHIFLPIEIANTPLIKTLKMFAISDNEDEQIAGVDALSFMTQPECELPEYIKKKFVPLAITFRTSFNNNTARLGCLYFIHNLLKNVSDLPIEIIHQINEQFVDVFNDKKNRYLKLFSSCLDCIRMEILYYPRTFQFLLDNNLIQIANELLKSNKHKIITSANRLFSVIFTTYQFDISFICPYLKYSNIIDNCGYEIKLSVQESALWLIIDIATRGPIFIQKLLEHGILKFLYDIFPSQELIIKKLFIKIITNFLLNSSNQQDEIIITSPIVEIACSEIQIFGENDILKFLISFEFALRNISKSSNYFGIKYKLLQSSFVPSLLELENCESELIIQLSRSIIMTLQSNN